MLVLTRWLVKDFVVILDKTRTIAKELLQEEDG